MQLCEDGQARLRSNTNITSRLGRIAGSKGGDVVEDRSRVARKRNEKQFNSEKRKTWGLATLRNFADLGRIISALISLWDRFSS